MEIKGDTDPLTRTAEEGLLSGEMDRRVHAVEGAADDTVVGSKNV